MGINKVQYGNTTLIDLTGTTATADKILTGYGAYGRDGVWMDGTAKEGGDVPVWQGADDYVYFSDTVTPPYEISMIDGYVVIDLPPAVLQTKTRTYTPTTSQQTETITADSGYDGLEEVDITVNAIQTETKSATPSETAQTITPSSGKYLSSVSVGAIASDYVGSGIAQRSSASLTTSGATVTAPSGYYSSNASATVASGTAGTPTATKGAVSNHSVSVTPSVTNTTGYITGSTKTGTAVTVTATELASGNKAITSNGTNIDVVGYSTVSVDVQGGGGDISTVLVTITTSLSDIIAGPLYDEGNFANGGTISTGWWSASGLPFYVLYNENFNIDYGGGYIYYGNQIQYISTSSNRTITPTNNIQLAYTSTIGNCTIYTLEIMGDNASFTVT